LFEEHDRENVGKRRDSEVLQIIKSDTIRV
jgi:hypothetical protein